MSAARRALGATTPLARWGEADVHVVKTERLTAVGAQHLVSKRTSVDADLATKPLAATETQQVYGGRLTHRF